MGQDRYVTRDELHEVRAEIRNDVDKLSRKVHELNSGQHNLYRKMDELLALTQKNVSLKAWAGWALVTATSAAVGTVLTHLHVGHP